MLLTKIQARQFLSFDEFDLDVGGGLTVVTGPNGVGKTNLGRCVDVVCGVLARNAGATDGDRLDLYQDAGRYRAEAFQVTLGLTLDQRWERDLVLAFVRAALASAIPPSAGGPNRIRADLDAQVRAQLTEDSLAALWSACLHVQYDARRRNPWFAAWEFRHDIHTWHIPLAGPVSSQLRGGAADVDMLPSGAVLNLTETLFHTARDTEVEGATSLRRVPMDLHAVLPSPGVAMSLHVAPPVDGGPIPISVHELAARLGIRDAEGRAVEFVHVIWEILRRGVVLSDNRRLPFRRSFTPGDLDRPLSLRDGSNIPLELCRLKNGDIDQRRRYGEIEDTFAQLTGRRLGLRARSAPAHVSSDGLIIEPTVVTDRGELPVEFAGAGVQEALVWSTLLPGDPGRIIVLDEPAVNLEPTVQRRLIGTLRDSGQCLVITHSPDLVPIDRPEDLANVVRLAPTNNGPLLRRADINNRKEWVRRVKLMEDIHVRALLFAAKVILCEGSTEVGALRRWWSNAACVDLPDPEAANIAVIGVGGDNSFGAYVEYLDAFGLPWAIVTDGPALRPTSSLARQLRRLAHLPAEMPDPDDDFERWHTSWQSAGVFSLADAFGDDGTKGGEFEEFLARADPTLLATVQSEIGTTSKPRVGALFATKHPTPPPEVLNLYRLIMQWFGYDIGPRQFTGPSPSRRTPTSGAAHHHLP